MSPLPTAFTDLVGCRLPLQLAPMGGGVGSPELAAAVSEAGGLGMLPSSFPLPVADQLAAVRRRSDGPIGVAFFSFDLPHRLADVEYASAHARVVDFFWDEPRRDVVDRIHAGGALGFWQVGSLDAALAAADAGCDAVVVQGVEAGGHVCSTTPLLTLVEQAAGRLDVPIVAAGGITTAARLEEVLGAGASAARIGTRFLATRESAAHPAYLQALLDADGDDTVVTTAFHVGWADATHRVLRSCIAAAGAHDSDEVGESDYEGARWPVPRWSAQPPSTYCSGQVEAMAMYAGAGVGDVTEITSVADAVTGLLPRR